MRNGFYLLFLWSMLYLLVSGCGHSSEGSSAIIGGGPGVSGGAGAGTINGTVWKDLNKDKIINPGEPGIPGINVVLFKDSNGNGALDSTDEQVATTTTDSNGNYSFTVTSTGRYYISVDETQLAINGLTLITPNDEPNFEIIPLHPTVTLTADVSNLNTGIQNVNFGFFSPMKWSTAIKDTPSGTAGPAITPPFISSPAVAPDGTVYVGATDHFLYALKPDGTVKWKYETGNSLFASPAIGSDGTIYIGSEDRQFYAINPDGTLKWVIVTNSVFTSSAAIASDGTIYVAGTNQDKTIFSCANVGICSVTKTTLCTSDSDCPAKETCGPAPSVTVQLGNFYAIDPNAIYPEKRIKWSVGLSGVVNSSPAIAPNGTIYIGSNGDVGFDRSNICNPNSVFPSSNADPSAPAGGHLYAIKPDGTLKWDFKTLGATGSSPAIGADGTTYVGSERPLKFFGKDHSTLLDQNPTTEGFLTAINPNGTLKCFVDLFGDVDSSPAVGSDGTIYVGSDSEHVFALNPDCSIKWIEPTRDKVKSSPAIASDGLIYIGSNDGSFYAFNADDGAEKLRFDTVGAVNSSPSIGLDGTVYFASASSKGDNVESNSLYAIIGTNSTLAQSPWPKFRRDLPNTGRQ